ncbi:MAG: hypothetical protein ACI9N3_000755 [Colwellia sp.]|jgi:hypothetical protein
MYDSPKTRSSATVNVLPHVNSMMASIDEEARHCVQNQK